jgi:putative DNA primase/helicase
MTMAAELSQVHQEELLGSCIDPEHSAARGYRTLHDTEESRRELKDLRVPRWAWRDASAFPGLLIPMYRATGEQISYQFKPAVPQTVNDKAQKYASQSGVPNHLDVPPLCAEHVRDIGHALWITEGVKKGDCLASRGEAVVTLTGVFNWRAKSGTLGDWEDVPLRGRSVIVCFDSDARRKRTVLLAMRRLGNWLESKGADTVRYLIIPDEVDGVPVKGVDDYFCAGGTMEGLKDYALKEMPADSNKDAAFSDAVLSDTVCSEALDGSFRWAAGLGWMQWSGKVWQAATDATVTETVRLWGLEQFHKVLDRQRDDPNRDLKGQMDGWRSVLSKGRLTALVTLARGILECHATDFDSDPDLLNCQNGVLDLRTGHVTPHDPDLLMTKITGADYVKGAEHPDLDTALTALPSDVRSWFQLRMGQGLTGHPAPDGVAVINQGGGANGKSTVCDICAKAAGERNGYHIQVADRAILGNGSDNHPTELMDFMGARLAVLEETPEARQLDMNRVKKLLDTRTITARKIQKDGVTFEATHTLFINSNYELNVAETDRGTWRRLALLKWPYTYVKTADKIKGPMDRLGDGALKQRLMEDPRAAEAALAWLVEGARQWYRDGRVLPDHPQRVEDDTLAWRKKSDMVLAFIDDHLVFDRGSHILSARLHKFFNEWLEEKTARPWSDKTFTDRFGNHEACSQNGVAKAKIRRRPGFSQLPGDPIPGNFYNAWLGIRFKDPNEEGQAGGGPKIDVPGVPGSPVNSPADPIAGPSGEPGTPGTLDTDGPCVQPEKESQPVTETQESDPFADLPDPTEREESDPFECLAEGSSGDEVAPLPDGPSGPREASLGFDLETRSVGELYTHPGPGYVKLAGSIGLEGGGTIHRSVEDLVAKLEAAEEIYGHNILNFDLIALAREAKDPTLYDRLAVKAVDTLTLAKLADPPGAKGSKPWGVKGYYGMDQVAQRLGVPGKTDDLAALATRYGKAAGYTGKEAEEEGYGLIPEDDPEYRSYLHGDLTATRAVRRAQGPLSDYARREMKVAYRQNRMTLSGWRVDVPLLAERVEQEEERRQGSLRWLAEECGVPLTETKSRGRGASKEFYEEPRLSPLASNVGREALIRAFLEAGAEAVPRTQSGVLATSSDAMGEGSYMIGKGAAGRLAPGMLNPQAYGHIPRIREICEHVVRVTGASAKYAEIQKYLIGDRVHPLIGNDQASGRWAFVKPSYTNLGKRGPKVTQRAVALADDGEVLICFDLDQVDMRCFAGHCQDPAYMALFIPTAAQPKPDAHSMISDKVYGRHDGEWRDKAKRAGHGWNYGLSVKGLVNSGIDQEVAQKFDQGMQEAFPGLMAWRQKVRALGEDGQLLDNGFGRLMRCDPKRAYTQAPALMGQGTARDIMAEGILRLPQEYVPWLRGVVHDEIVLSVPEARVDEAIERVTEALTMEFRGVPITCGASKPARDWASCYLKD